MRLSGKGKHRIDLGTDRLITQKNGLSQIVFPDFVLSSSMVNLFYRLNETKCIDVERLSVECVYSSIAVRSESLHVTQRKARAFQSLILSCT